MRTKIVVLIALAVSLALIGQRVSLGQETKEEDYQIRTYDVSDLLKPVIDRFGDEIIPFIQLPPSPAEAEPAMVEGYTIIEIIRENIGGEWNGPTGIAFQETRGRLVVRQTPDVLKKIEGLLDYIRTTIKKERLVTVEATAVIIDTALLEEIKEKNPSVILEDAVVETILGKGEVYKVVKVNAYSGQRTHIKQTIATPYIKDYDSVIGVGGESGQPPMIPMIADPIPALIFDGILLEVTPFITLDRKDTRIDLELTVTEIIKPIGQFDPKITIMGIIEQPEVEITEIRTSVSVPVGKTILSGSATMKTRPGKSIILLITPTIETSSKTKDTFPTSPERHLKIMDVGNIVRPLPLYTSFFNSVLSLMPVAATRTPEPGPVLAIDDLIELIKHTVAPETWEEGGHSLRRLGETTQLGMVHESKVIKEVEDLVNDLTRGERLVTIEARLLRLDNAYWRELQRENRKSGSMTLSPKKTREILNEAKKDKKVRLLARIEITGFNYQPVALGQGRAQNFVKDMDVTGNAGEPVLGAVGRGLFANLFPVLSADGQYIDLTTWMEDQELISLEPTNAVTGCIQKPIVDNQRFRGDVIVPVDGSAVLAGVTTSGVDEKGQSIHTALLIQARIVK